VTPRIQVGSILIEDRSLVTRILDLGNESYSAKWGVLKVLDHRSAASDGTIPSLLRE
jgi:hypothetical protein